ncbi:DUF2894 domain-containing protein [Marinobacter sp. 1_MG-2023]|uniref:DUF2894 domain-containing protein n=1 Tax=Marinobacter sp. 1_MG-2023 TaxID=3062627 RepID=UPI0026E2AC89|nr:DUF2894 domain-containing protein [Marinobacter sp. 1_MG-2023]MDO6822876.1 DUF2894 domain-containing protein [Marinobacter sp. 1_MG-2023]
MTTAVETAPMHPQLEELRNCGANRANPARFRYLESLALRLRAKGLQQTRHWQKLEQAISDYQASYESPAQPSKTDEAHSPSPLSDLLERLNQSPNIPATQPSSTLEQLVFGAAQEDSSPAQRRPLKAMTRASAGCGEQALQERIRHAIEHAPKDAGPINAHRLVSRALAEMQKLSPEYLKRFVNYTDTLMALERLGRKG